MKLTNIDTIKNIDKTNYYKLKKWYEEIKDYEKLTLKEAKVLNRLILTSSKEKSEKYRNKLILGTIYLVYNFVCNSGLTAIKSSYFDIDDLMNTSIEIWINMIDTNILLNDNVKNYARLFLKEFYVRLNKHLIGENTKYYSNEEGYNKMSEYIFGNMLKFYLESINNGNIIDKKSEFNCILSYLEECGILHEISSSSISEREKSRLIYEIYSIFHNIRRVINIEDISRLSKTKLDYLKLLLFDTSILDSDIKLITIDDFTEEVDRKVLAHNIIKYVSLTAREREVLTLRYNTTANHTKFVEPSYREAGKVLGINKSRVKQLEDKALERIKSYYSK